MNRGSSVVNWICVEDPFSQIRSQNIGKGETSRKVHYVATYNIAINVHLNKQNYYHFVIRKFC